MSVNPSLKMGDRVENPKIRPEAGIGTVERLAWGTNPATQRQELRYVFVNWQKLSERRWEIPALLRHSKEGNL
jgi:hypothetical protein